MQHTIVPNTDFYTYARPEVEDALAACEQVLPSYKEIRIVLNYTDSQFVCEYMGGSTGKAGGETTMEIEVNTGVEGWQKNTKGSVAHEYNHVMWHQIHGKDWKTVTLRELLVMEGLAQHFEAYFIGGPPVFATYVDSDTLGGVWEKTQSYLDENGPEWWQRLSFEDSDEFPLWSGYSLAYSVVGERISQLDLPWPELMKVDANTLIEGGLEK